MSSAASKGAQLPSVLSQHVVRTVFKNSTRTGIHAPELDSAFGNFGAELIQEAYPSDLDLNILDVYAEITQNYHNLVEQERTADIRILNPWLRFLVKDGPSILHFDTDYLQNFIKPAWDATESFRKVLYLRASVMSETNSEVKSSTEGQTMRSDRETEMYLQRHVYADTPLSPEQSKIPALVKLHDSLEQLNLEQTKAYKFVVFTISISPTFNYLMLVDTETRQVEVVRTSLPSISPEEETRLVNIMGAKTTGLSSAKSRSGRSQKTNKSGKQSTVNGLKTNGSINSSQPSAPLNTSSNGYSHTEYIAGSKLASMIEQQAESIAWFCNCLVRERFVVLPVNKTDFKPTQCTALSMFYLSLRLQKGLSIVKTVPLISTEFPSWLNTFVSPLSLKQWSQGYQVRWNSLIKTSEVRTEAIVEQILLDIKLAAQLGQKEWELPIDLDDLTDVCQALARQNITLRRNGNSRLSRVVWI